MSRTFTTTLDLSIGGDTPTWEGEATVSFTVSWGRAETPPSYSHGGLPADPDTVEDITVTHIDGEAVGSRTYGKHEAQTLETHIECSDRLVAELLTYAVEAEADAGTHAAEQRYKDMRERF